MFREVFLEAHRQAEEWIRELCRGGYTVVLFGSRARGEARIDSDWDVVVIGEEPPPEPPHDLVQAHFATAEEARRLVAEFNTVFVDAFYEGVLICGDERLFQGLKALAVEATRGYVKTREGWVAKKAAGP
ncbi:MAG: nucleotidyltransferase domain-containing protein [Pyrobaculum sp.]